MVRNLSPARPLLVWLGTLVLVSLAIRAELVVSEILFNPPGVDAPNEYIELRGTPNMAIPDGTYLVAVEGDAAGNPGTIQNTFDLSGRPVGGNGFLVLLQKGSRYTVKTNATVLVNADSGPGWGSGSTSSIGHRGKNGQTDLENASVSFFLVQSTNAPAVGSDIDSNDDGTPDGPVFAGWTVLDSVGVLDADGPGDFAYAAVNFRRNTAPGNGASALGVIVPVGFTPSYVARVGNTVGSTAADWVASDGLGVSGTGWTLGGAANTVPASLAGATLNHIGGPNFGAVPIPGVVLQQSDGGTEVTEAGVTDSYTLALNTRPAGPVTIQIDCGPQLEVSTDDGATFGGVRSITLTGLSPTTITVRATDDNVVDTSPHRRFVTNTVTATGDPGHYPLNSLVPDVRVSILENDSVLFSELKVNPPGPNDTPDEFIEIKGPASAWLTNVYVLAIEGKAGADPGKVNYALNLSGARLGSSGLLVVAATNHPYAIPSDTTVLTAPEFSEPGGALGNGTISFLLVSSASEISAGEDLDHGDNGVLEGLPGSATILDAVAWSEGNTNDLVYGEVVLTLPSGTPDAATRVPGNDTPNSAASWLYGDLAGTNGDSIVYDPLRVSAGFPIGTQLTPGSQNRTAPTISPILPVSGVIGDPWNPEIVFTVASAATSASTFRVTATSMNQTVVPDSGLHLTSGTGGAYTLTLIPQGIGYSAITVWVSDGSLTGQVTFPYAASAPGRPGGAWHLGASDGSAAIAVDADFMFVGDDENQTLRLYNRYHSGLPIEQFDMTDFLELPDVEAGQKREVDVEAATRLGNHIYWMGSHSHANIGETRTNRTRLWQTDLSGVGASSVLTPVAHYDYLKADLIEWDRQDAHGKGANYYGLEASDAEGVMPKAEDGSGFSIEGLAMMPGSTTGAYVAFRAPIVPATNREFALIVPVLNFAILAGSGGPPGSSVFGVPIELDLYGRGIRSLEGDTNGYLIVAGPARPLPGAYPRDFRLYTWTGNPEDQPQQRTADLSGLNPEGIVELPSIPWTPETGVQLLSDNGLAVYYGDGIEAKHLAIPNFKKCRSDVVTLGTVVKPAPIITSTTWSGSTLGIRWRALKGETYRIQSTKDLSQANWIDVAGDVQATGPYAYRVTSLTTPPGFYRVLLVP